MMYILTRKNRVIDYCISGYHYIGNIVVCEDKNCIFEDATIVKVDNIPEDIDNFSYDYLNGEFIKIPKTKTTDSSYYANYLAFIGANTDMVSAAFGKGNEDMVEGIGKALIMYSRFKGEEIVFSTLQNYNSLKDISTSQEAISEVLGSESITALIRSNSYSAPYIGLWRLNEALPEEYRRDNWAAILQNVEIMSYMYDNYATYEALNIFNSSAITDFISSYTSDTGYITSSDSNSTCVLYNKKCLVLKIQTIKNAPTGEAWGSSTQKLGYRADGSIIDDYFQYQVPQVEKGTVYAKNYGFFCSKVTTIDFSNNNSGQPLKVIYIPCE